MKSLVFLSLLFGNVAFAQNLVSTEVKPSVTEKAIRAGNYELNGSFSLGQSTTIDVSYFQFSPNFGYFVADRLLLGGSLSLTSSKSQYGTVTSYGLGPSISFFFWESGSLTADVGQKLLYNSTDGTPGWSGASSIGLKYFFNPNVAFGFELTTSYGLTERISGRNTSLNGAFATYF